MKLTRRRATPPIRETAIPDLGAYVSGDGPPEGTVATAYAEVLDGRRLWLAVAARPGRLALRGPGGALVPLLDETADEGAADEGDDRPTGYLSARLDLAGLPAPADHAAADADAVTYDLVWADDGGDPVPLWAPPGAARPDPPWTHDAAGRPIRHTLLQGERGRLRLRTVALPPAATLIAVSLGPPGTAYVDLRVAVASDQVSQVLLVPADDVADGAPLLTLPVTDGRARLAADDVLDLPARLAAVVAVAGDRRLPVRRRAGDLSAPGFGAPLPELTRDDADGGDSGDGVSGEGEPVLRLRWSSRALLQARLLGSAS